MPWLINNTVNQIEIKPEIISKLVDWLFSCFWRFDFNDEAIILSLSLLKVFLKNKVV
jgi:hypothetical protein